MPSDDFGFFEPPWAAPLNADKLISEIPESATIAGMFYLAVQEAARRRGTQLTFTRDRYMQFGFYSLREFGTVLVQAAQLFYPARPLRQGLRLLGAAGPRAFATSTLGKVTLGSSSEVDAALGAIAKTYEINLPGSRCRVIESAPRRMRFSVENVYHFLDCHHVGVFEGTLQHAGVQGSVRIKSQGAHSAELLVEWT
ncbi:MAG TPA: DUF2378 family protein [Polyangiaceae bacterium]|jgi:uncharacterized protein (TIGR02265 family)|nr:DUF2378 family protein [Polyangiaceae bacterium]